MVNSPALVSLIFSFAAAVVAFMPQMSTLRIKTMTGLTTTGDHSFFKAIDPDDLKKAFDNQKNYSVVALLLLAIAFIVGLWNLLA